MASKLPYLTTPGTIENALNKVKAAATPPTFNNDFVHAVLQIKGGAGKSVAPFFKKLGLVSDAGVPTALYQKLRNPSTAGGALATATKHAYKPLFDVNEYTDKLSEKDLKGLILQVTGLEQGNRTADLIFQTFSKLKKGSSFDGAATVENVPINDKEDFKEVKQEPRRPLQDLRIGYTINLNLPASTNIEVFDAIFQSLRKNLLTDEQ
ncbi:DUF5343 domain-containing protein [Xanthomonas campestris]|uniref:DUF5343 domain-containing protein n=1 Tax=Xanthomonas campestris TaxID=339 RepID=UPI003CFB65A9